MLIAVGSDHAGFNLKNEILKYLKDNEYEFKDFGTYSSESTDYPLYGELVAKAVANKEYDFGILVCGTGIGISIAANKVRGIRACVCSDCFSAQASRNHNDANVLALGERVVGTGLALKIVETFLNSEFEGGRHAKRVNMIGNIEEKNK